MATKQSVFQYQRKLAVISEQEGLCDICRQLAERLGVPLISRATEQLDASFFLSFRDGNLKLLDRSQLKKGGLFVNIEPRSGEQRSWPAPKKGILPQALGRKTRNIVDATAGWGQDGLHMFRMGYNIQFIERSPVMAELLKEGLQRLARENWVLRRGLKVPELIQGNANVVLAQLEENPECVYLDPMFPAKPKKSALAKKSMTVLRELLGDDQDKQQLFEAAFQVATRRVVVKAPDYAEPLAGKPSECYVGKLFRYDVYIKG